MEELPFGQGFVRLADQELRSARREGRDEARKGVVSAPIVLGHDRVAQRAKREAEVVDDGGDKGATHDAAGHEDGERDPKRPARRR